MAYVSQQTTEEWQTFFKATDRDPIDEVHFVTRAHEKRYSDVKESDLAEISFLSESDRTGGAFATLIHREDATIDDQWDRGGVVLPLAAQGLAGVGQASPVLGGDPLRCRTVLCRCGLHGGTESGPQGYRIDAHGGLFCRGPRRILGTRCLRGKLPHRAECGVQS